MTKKYPLKIIEVPHIGKRREWTLWSEDHLNDILTSGQFSRAGVDAQNLEEFLDWLRQDLSLLFVEEMEH